MTSNKISYIYIRNTDFTLDEKLKIILDTNKFWKIFDQLTFPTIRILLLT